VRKRVLCPTCRSARSAEVLYGMPAYSERLERDLAQQKVVLGGCIVTGNDPNRECLECGERWRQEDPALLYQMQRRLAETSIGPSALRNQGSAGVIQAAKTFMEKLDLGAVCLDSESRFQRVLNKLTERLRSALPPNAQHWGAARKALNLFLRDAFYNRYTFGQYGLARLEPWLEVPLDKYVAIELLKGDRSLPRWEGVKYLSPATSELYQASASIMAERRGVARVHLDLWLYRPGNES
jgi:hypothetical protein